MKHNNRFLTTLSFLTIITTSVLSQTTSESLPNGRRLYADNCANCHGDAGQGAIKAGFEISIITERGGKQPPNLIDALWDHGSTDLKIAKVIKEGIPSNMMPPFSDRLSDLEIQSVIKYVRSLASSKGNTTLKAAPGSTLSSSQGSELTLELANYLELPITGDSTTSQVSGVLARGSILLDEPGSGQRTFINDLNGPLYIFNKQTKKLATYIDFAKLFPKFSAAVGYASGLMNFVFDPEYATNGVFYSLHMELSNDASQTAVPKAGVVPGLNLAGYTTTAALLPPIPVSNTRGIRDMVLVEWTDNKTNNTTFEGTAREVIRMQLPGVFHPLNEITFNPAARKGDPDWRVMYLGVGDAGTGERSGPAKLYAQRLDTYQGKILRIIPALSEHKQNSILSENGRYRIPKDNPFVSIAGARKEIWALGLRNPHRLTWYVDPARPREALLFAFNIGLVSWETVVIVKKGANYGYPMREGTQSMSAGNAMGPIPTNDLIPVQITDTITNGTVKPNYAVVAYPHAPGGGDAIANGFFYRGKRITELKGCFVFGDITTGRIWYSRIEDVLAADDGNPLTVAPIKVLSTKLRAMSEETYRKRTGRTGGLPGRGAISGSGRIDLRLAEDNAGELYVITKGDGMIRSLISIK